MKCLFLLKRFSLCCSAGKAARRTLGDDMKTRWFCTCGLASLLALPFVAQAQPVRLWEWIGALFESMQVPRPARRVPARVAYAGGAALELVWRLARLRGEPPMTRFVARQLATSHSYDLAPARRDFGYRERVSLEEGTERLIAWLRSRAAQHAS